MTSITRSYEKVHYEFRPAKQVERKMLLDTFLKLMSSGFHICDYQYTGFGSVYFIDFILFHKYLGINKLVSVEYSNEIEKRVIFNKPFNCIQVAFEDIINYVPTLNQDIKHILWLDYDSVIHENILSTITLASSILPVGSFLLITVDVEQPGTNDDPKESMNYFQGIANQYLPPNLNIRDFNKSNLPLINSKIINNSIATSMLGRGNTKFIPMFNFLYKDGHKMLSVGGCIGTDTEERQLRSLDRRALPFLRDSIIAEPYEIRVPLLTRRERIYLDSNMPCASGWLPDAFEMKQMDVECYSDIYRYYPAFTEMLL